MTGTEHGVADDFDAPATFDPAIWGWVPPDPEGLSYARPMGDDQAELTLISRVQFANPYHDERGRFARKGEGRRVPTRGVDDSGVPDRVGLAPETEADRWRDVRERHRQQHFEQVVTGDEFGSGRVGEPVETPGPGTFLAHENWGKPSPGRFLFSSDRGTTPVHVPGDGSGWSIDNPDDVRRMAEIVYASQNVDPTIKIEFAHVPPPRGPGAPPPDPTINDNVAVVQQGWDTIWFPNRGTVPANDAEWEAKKAERPSFFMPAAKDATYADYIVTHEHGHVAHFRAGTAAGITEYRARVNNIIRFVNASQRRSDRGGLSDYGLSDPWEAVAEAFVQRKLDPDNLSPTAAFVLEMAEV